MIRKGCNQKEILTTITSVCGLGVGEEKLNWQSGINTKRTYRKPSGQLFPNRRPLCYPNLTKI